MAGYLTTHVLDTARGLPAEGLKIELFRVSDNKRELIRSTVTNDDGRTDEQILGQEAFQIGEYELLFHCGEYIKKHNQVADDLLFLDVVPIRFGMSQDVHYHVPLLLSPYGYSTYRGS